MKHTTIDHFAKDSPFYRIDPRAKISGFLLFVVCVALMQSLPFLTLAFIVIFLFGAGSNVPTGHLVIRYALSLPFILFASVTLYFSSGTEFALAMFIRISTCVLALITLTATTDFFDLLKGFQSMKMPRIFLGLLMFMYRFIFLLREEMHRMAQARKARGFRGGKHLLDREGFRTISYTIGALLVRSSERGNRIYDGMLTRGYDGSVRTLNPMKFGAVALVFAILLSFISVALLLGDWGVVVWV
jgi:cobalt/nickel transport system permease protein